MGKKPVQQANKDSFLDRLEAELRKILDDPKATQRAKNTAIQHGIKLAQIRHGIEGVKDDGEFFG